ncbi:LolA family protein [Luteipulveratus halotolerans]|uniref:MucB/RseB N-terminal domain-containing protein n=1 Tax=Luteipulveratus halotolerans TaxID=1631356 RepID=A0A0L6CIX2_9MICO|nr:hypothetical protein [Luteipulveratus halotolerans]KNX37751.1 hypothetical protein VV01_12285 [Luteipulveratus halotolerans]
MSLLADHPSLRWTAPVTVAACLIGGSAVAGRMAASADTELPSRTAAQLMTDVQNARVDGLSGTVTTSVDLGLPALPSIAGHSSSELSSLVSGSHTLRVWASGEDKARVALLGSDGESDVIRNGKDVWVWSSQAKKATHLTLGDQKRARAQSPVPATPQEATNALLTGLRPSTDVSVGPTTTVAGRSAYELVLRPKQSGTLVKDVRVAIDGKTKVPLRLQVHSTKIADPAVEIGFTAVDFGKPDASRFAFNPPPGTDVRTKTVAPHDRSATDADKAPVPGRLNDLLKATQPNVVGTGWSSVLTATLPKASGSGNDSPDVAQLATMLPRVQGSWGSGHQLTGTLFTVLVTDDGRLLAGAVPPQTLYAAAAR